MIEWPGEMIIATNLGPILSSTAEGFGLDESNVALTPPILAHFAFTTVRSPEVFSLESIRE